VLKEHTYKKRFEKLFSAMRKSKKNGLGKRILGNIFRLILEFYL
jgi:hypothetical protein